MSIDAGNLLINTFPWVPKGRSMSLVDLTFVEEPLGMPASDGYGWPRFEFGEKLGPEKRYTIVRKLGWGMTSSTWLAHDLRRVLSNVFSLRAFF